MKSLQDYLNNVSTKKIDEMVWKLANRNKYFEDGIESAVVSYRCGLCDGIRCAMSFLPYPQFNGLENYESILSETQVELIEAIKKAPRKRSRVALVEAVRNTMYLFGYFDGMKDAKTEYDAEADSKCVVGAVLSC